MSLAHSAPEPRRVRCDVTGAALTPPIVPRLREYSVTSRQTQRKAQLVHAAIYVLCFVVGIASGLLAARLLGAPMAGAHGERPVVTIRTLP